MAKRYTLADTGFSFLSGKGPRKVGDIVWAVPRPFTSLRQFTIVEVTGDKVIGVQA